jgi:hypothetical protein
MDSLDKEEKMDFLEKEEKMDPLYRKEIIEELKAEIKRIFLMLKYNHSRDIRDLYNSRLILEFNINMSRYNELREHYKSTHYFNY